MTYQSAADEALHDMRYFKECCRANRLLLRKNKEKCTHLLYSIYWDPIVIHLYYMPQYLMESLKLQAYYVRPYNGVYHFICINNFKDIYCIHVHIVYIVWYLTDR